MADKVKVLLTLRPDEPWEVGRDEIESLRQEGLLLEVLDDDGKPQPQPPAPVPAAVVKENAE